MRLQQQISCKQIEGLQDEIKQLKESFEKDKGKLKRLADHKVVKERESWKNEMKLVQAQLGQGKHQDETLKELCDKHKATVSSLQKQLKVSRSDIETKEVKIQGL